MVRRAPIVDEPGLEQRLAAAASFEAFYREHYPPVVRLAVSVLGDFHAAQDVAQEVFLAAHRRFSGDVEGAPGWVRVAAVHTALNVLRGDRRRDRRHQLAPVPVAAAGPEDTVLEKEARAELHHALSRLPGRSATVLILRHNGMKYNEIAEVLGIKAGHVGTMLRRAEAALSKEMNRAPRP